ncbi:unnamed protein product [Calypogeia fissa]
MAPDTEFEEIEAPKVAAGGKNFRSRPKPLKSSPILTEGGAAAPDAGEKKMRKRKACIMMIRKFLTQKAMVYKLNRKWRTKKLKDSYKRSIYKVMREVHPEFDFSSKELSIINPDDIGDGNNVGSASKARRKNNMYIYKVLEQIYPNYLFPYLVRGQ